jgi:hypothetical protein
MTRFRRVPAVSALSRSGLQPYDGHTRRLRTLAGETLATLA